MGANTANAMLFLVTTLVDLALLIYLLRVLLQWSRADFYNPISQAIWKATRYPGDWLRPHLPNWRNLNIASVLMLVALAVIYIYVVTGMLGFSIGIARSEEHTSELQSLMRISYAVFCLKQKKKHHKQVLVKTCYSYQTS